MPPLFAKPSLTIVRRFGSTAFMCAFAIVSGSFSGGAAENTSILATSGSSTRALDPQNIVARIKAARTSFDNDQATAGMSLEHGLILAPLIVVQQAGSVPALTFSYKAGASGLGGILFTFTAASGQSIVLQYIPPRPAPKSGLVFFVPANLVLTPYVDTGKWTLTDIYMYNTDYTGKDFDQALAAKAFFNNSIFVINKGQSDNTPPTVLSGQILTPKVSFSDLIPQFRASFNVKDAASGIEYAYVYVQPPGGAYSNGVNSSVPFPIKSGLVTAYVDIDHSQPKGVWKITQFLICDVASNCTKVSDEDEIMRTFGTNNFEVTN